MYTEDMALPSGFARITLNFHGAAVPTGAANVLCVANPGDLSPAEVAEQFNDAADGNLWTSMSNTVSVPTLIVKLGPDSTGAQGEFASTLAGGATGASGAAAPAALITKSTAAGGRKNKGRIFLPAIPESSIDQGGSLGPSIITAMQDDADALLANLESNLIPLCVEHGDGSTPEGVIALTVQALVATQRRRQRR